MHRFVLFLFGDQIVCVPLCVFVCAFSCTCVDEYVCVCVYVCLHVLVCMHVHVPVMKRDVNFCCHSPSNFMNVILICASMEFNCLICFSPCLKDEICENVIVRPSPSVSQSVYQPFIQLVLQHPVTSVGY